MCVILDPYFVMLLVGNWFSPFSESIILQRTGNTLKLWYLQWMKRGFLSDGNQYWEVKLPRKSTRPLFGLGSRGRKGCMWLVDHSFLFTEHQEQSVWNSFLSIPSFPSDSCVRMETIWSIMWQSEPILTVLTYTFLPVSSISLP